MIESPKLKFKLEHPEAKLPTYAHDGDAGMDAYAAESKVIGVGETVAVSLGFRVEIPRDYQIEVRSKSGLTLKHNIVTANSPGTIDSGFTGIAAAILRNNGTTPYVVQVGEKVCQLVVGYNIRATIEEVDEVQAGSRGENGFGSTGLK